MSGNRPATSMDVARAAGVSQATVSYVLNDRPGSRISEETRARVRDAAERLGYVPHAGARTLRTGSSGLVLVALPDIPQGTLATGFFEGLDRELGGRGYMMVQYGARQVKGVAAAKAWAELRPAAVLADADRLTGAGVDVLRAAGVKAIIGMGAGAAGGVPSVLTDHGGVGALAVRHLVDKGRSEIVVVVPREEGIRPMGLERLRGARSVGVPVRAVDLAFDEGEAAAFVAGLSGGEGVFAYNDDYAMLLLAALHDAGLAVPGEVAVVGCDDLPLSRLTRPRLTTVRPDLSVAPASIATLIDRLVRGERCGDVGIWTLELIGRDST
ncbi:LacI family DNA-binding transcriptional regulator [Nonomuraea sp. NPDC059194]|uniref:LacI family DNA-binding transcriptional regulator n=1 Tax=Nonomuraea sp. NPDC059194 TaxID=3346764 RepID=UPI0036946783